MPRESVSSTISAQNTFTSVMNPIGGFLNFSLTGTWAGTITLKRSIDGGTTWGVVATYTENDEQAIDDPQPDSQYKAGFETGDYTSGSAVCTLSA
jgi:hypothetical protein